MIQRYTLKEMGELWSPQSRFQFMLEVEIAVAKVQAECGMIPLKAAEDIEQKATFDVARIDEIEKTTRHDVIAFVSNVAENVGPNGRYVHFGLTSSDVLDTALSLQIRKAAEKIQSSISQLKLALLKLIKEEAYTLCSGRTHGMHAEPTSFGWKMIGYFEELERNEVRLKQAVQGACVCKLSGAVGTYSALSEDFEHKVSVKLNLPPGGHATQVIPRDRHAEVFLALALLGSGLERLATEFRHLQRTEVGEVEEGFAAGQKGSSAMPHKKNPITGENITGLARLLRSYSQASLENIPLWHERDISHSSVERVIFPDAFILTDYILHRMTNLVANLKVNADRMKSNMDLSGGRLMSSQLLLALIEKGLSREQAYSVVQRLSHLEAPSGAPEMSHESLKNLRDLVKSDPQTRALLDSALVDSVFSGERLTKEIGERVMNWLKKKERF